MFTYLIDEQLKRVKKCSQFHILSENAFDEFSKLLSKVTDWITESAMNYLFASEAAAWNSIVKDLPGLMTETDIERAKNNLKRKIAVGEFTFPNQLTEILNLQLNNITDGFIEMLCRLGQEKEIISKELGFDKEYSVIETLDLSLGDTHNYGRSVSIVTTDRGKFVYKPHDMRWDKYIYQLVEDYFKDYVGVAKCVTFGDDYGVCEYIEKERVSGEKAARAFWYKMGGLTTFFKLLGSTDMHVENITCAKGKPYIMDLETILSPTENVDTSLQRNPQVLAIGYHSITDSLLSPVRVGKYELSVLFNTEELGCTPEVEGKNTKVTDYLNDYLTGFENAYNKVLSARDNIEKTISRYPKNMPVRIILRNTSAYMDMIKKLYHYSCMLDEIERQKSVELLKHILVTASPDIYKSAAESEKEQMLRGDVPYLYALSGEHNLYSGGKVVAENIFGFTPLEHALDILQSMTNSDREFDYTYIKRIMEQYPAIIDIEADNIEPELAISPISKVNALEEAKKLFEQMYSLKIDNPNGHSYWGYISARNNSFKFCDSSFSVGLGGMAIFSTAYLKISGDISVCPETSKIVEEMKNELRNLINYFSKKLDSEDFIPELGEYMGIGGILKCLALVSKYYEDVEIDYFKEKIIELIYRIDFSKENLTDRIEGLAGFISTMCRFEEYKKEKELIKRAADRLVELYDLKFDGGTYWKTISFINRPISGAGHGLAGIAEALYAASTVTGKPEYIVYGRRALEFEQAVYLKYSDKYDTWADLRTYPPNDYMNGYCSGAPGIGIMLHYISQNYNKKDDLIEILLKEVKDSIARLPLNVKDHICCGNSAIVEYYLTIGDNQAAGRVLNSMYLRKVKEGEYRYRYYYENNSITPSIIDGVCGVGYEMLRFAYPDEVTGLL